MELTTWGYMDEDVEVLDFHVHKESDQKRGINLMIKNSGYFLSRIIPYLTKNKGKKIRLDNINEGEAAILYYLDIEVPLISLELNNKFNMEVMINSLGKRSWIEEKLTLYPALINTLWSLDYRGISPKTNEVSIPLTNNISYSRPEILDFDKKVYNEFLPNQTQCVILPCSTGKPYHKRKYNPDNKFTKISGGGKSIIQQYLLDENYDKIVLTSLGLIPQEFWMNDVVMRYDTGTRDLWKLLCLTKRFFLKNQYDHYVVLVKFKPYRDIIRNLIDMKVMEADQVEFIGEDEKSNGLRIMFYPSEYKLYK